jgi:hypothetical protein
MFEVHQQFMRFVLVHEADFRTAQALQDFFGFSLGVHAAGGALVRDTLFPLGSSAGGSLLYCYCGLLNLNLIAHSQLSFASVIAVAESSTEWS